MNIREAIYLVEMAGKNPTRDAVVLSAAKRLGYPTLELRGQDSLDYRDVAVSALREVLEAVYEAGRASNNGDK